MTTRAPAVLTKCHISDNGKQFISKKSTHLLAYHLTLRSVFWKQKFQLFSFLYYMKSCNKQKESLAKFAFILIRFPPLLTLKANPTAKERIDKCQGCSGGFHQQQGDWIEYDQMEKNPHFRDQKHIQTPSPQSWIPICTNIRQYWFLVCFWSFGFQ